MRDAAARQFDQTVVERSSFEAGALERVLIASTIALDDEQQSDGSRRALSQCAKAV